MNEKQFIKDRVTVVIPIYNEGRFLRQCLDSFAPQADRVILADNASTDDTEKICRELVSVYSNILYIRHDKNAGSCENTRIALSHVDTEYFIIVGGHDFADPQYIGRLRKTLSENLDCVMATGKTIGTDLQGRPSLAFTHAKEHDKVRFGVKYFMSDNPYVRAFGALNYGMSRCFFALYRSSEALEKWQQVQAVTGPDQVILFDIQTAGKTCYCDDAVIYRRNNHADDTLEKYMKRISLGGNGKEFGYRINDMIDAIEKTFRHLPKPNSLSGRYWQFRVYLKLKRFRSVNNPVYRFLKTIYYLPKKLVRTPPKNEVLS